MTRARRGRGPAVRVAVEHGVAWLTLDRPSTGNRLDDEMMGALADACEQVEHDERVAVVVVAATGRTFCAGLPAETTWPPDAWPDGIGALACVGKPVVGALAGAVRGWGLGLALACDVRVGATTTVLEPGAALPIGGGVTQRLPRVVGTGRALAMLLDGEPVRARVALEWGLLARVVPPARLLATTRRLARALAARGPVALRYAKEAVVRALDLPLDDGLRLEHDLYVLLQTTADRAEGIASFLAGRRARFVGR